MAGPNTSTPNAAADADPAPAARHRLEAALAAGALALLGKLNFPLASDVGAGLARLIGPLSGAWRTARANLDAALPELDASARQAVVRQAFVNFGRVMAEYAKLPWLWRTRWDRFIDVAGREHLQALGRKGAIVFSGHLGNWELIPMVLAALGKPALIVYRAPNNPLVDARIAAIRGLYAAGLAAKGAEGAREIIDHLKSGGVVYMLVDQKMNTGFEIPFFGRGAMTGKAVARLALRHACALVPARCERLGDCKFRVSFEAPWRPGGSDRNEADVRDVLTLVNRRIEDWVRATPGQWLWMHKRWPKA